jgi:hypothetical protein
VPCSIKLSNRWFQPIKAGEALSDDKPYQRRASNFEKFRANTAKVFGKNKQLRGLFDSIIDGIIEVVQSNPTQEFARIEGVRVSFVKPHGFRGYTNDNNNEFWKARFSLARGDSNQVRMLYIVHEQSKAITFVSVYTHAEWENQPDNDTLRTLFVEAGIPMPEIPTTESEESPE